MFELYRWLRRYWIRRILEKKKKAKQPRKPLVMQPKSERDCPFCVKVFSRCGLKNYYYALTTHFGRREYRSGAC
jgi:hypothetical protein